MKLIILCILVIFSVGIIRINAALDDCQEQIVNQIRISKACLARNPFNSDEFFSELTATLLQYSGNDTAVHNFGNTYCPILHHVAECRLLDYDVDVECLYPLAPQIAQQRYDVSNALLNYVCANNAGTLVRILQNSGFDTVYLNRQFSECVMVIDAVRYDIDATTLGPSAKQCEGVDRGFQCYADLVRDHQNQNLAEIASEIRVVFRQAMKC